MTNFTSRPRATALLKDPLVHFIILGALLFAAMSMRANNTPKTNKITITQTGQKHLADLFEITWQRPPTPNELENLIEEYIKEEIYYREALALGLDDNDTIVRRRMRQKLEFMQEDLSTAQVPTDAELRTFYAAHKDQYNTGRTLSFRQVLVAPRKTGIDTSAALAALQNGATPSDISKSSLLPVSMKLETEQAIINTFGAEFLSQFSALKHGQWDGPVTSSFGTHLVFISLDQPATPLSFETARAKIETDFKQDRRETSAHDYYDNLRSKYHVTILDTP